MSTELNNALAAMAMPLLDKLRQPPREHLPRQPDRGPSEDFEQRVVDRVVAAVMGRFKVSGQLPITVGGGEGQFVVGWNAPVVLAPPVFQQRVALPEPPLVGTAIAPYELVQGWINGYTVDGVFGSASSELAVDFWDITTPALGKDNDGVNLAPTYDSVIYKGPYLFVDLGPDANNTIDSNTDTTSWPFIPSITMVKRNITYNNLGAVAKIGVEYAQAFPIPAQGNSLAVDDIVLYGAALLRSPIA